MIAAGHSAAGLATASFGKTSRAPMLWIYATKDPFFGPDLARRFYDGFLSAVDHRLAGGARPISTDHSSRAIGVPRLARLLSQRTAQDQQIAC